MLDIIIIVIIMMTKWEFSQFHNFTGEFSKPIGLKAHSVLCGGTARAVVPAVIWAVG